MSKAYLGLGVCKKNPRPRILPSTYHSGDYGYGSVGTTTLRMVVQDIALDMTTTCLRLGYDGSLPV